MQLSHVMHDQTDSSLLTQLQLYGRTHSIYSDTRGCNGTEEVWKIIAANAANNMVGVYCTCMAASGVGLLLSKLACGVCMYIYIHCIVQNFDRGNIDGLASFRSLTGKILTNSPLDNLYLLYN